MQTRQPTLGANTDFAALDLLRAAAAFTVMISHVRNTYWLDYASVTNPSKAGYLFFAVTRIAHEAVMVFFVLSGFLVGGRLIQRVQKGTFRAGDYANDRATRIYTPLIPACLLAAAAGLYAGAPVGLWQIVCNMAGLNDVLAPTLVKDAPLWSLPFEIHFYVMAGALAYLVVGGKRVLLAFALLVWTVVVFCRLGSAHYVLFWGLGAASVFLLNVRRPILLGFAGFGVMATGVLLYQMSTESRSVHVGLAVPPALAEAAICIGLCLALPWLCGALSRTPRWAARLFTFLASFSYSLYLVHMPVIVFLEKGVPNATALNAHTLGIFGFRVAACLAVAFLFSLLFECQTPRLRRFIRLRTQGLKPVREVAP